MWLLDNMLRPTQPLSPPKRNYKLIESEPTRFFMPSGSCEQTTESMEGRQQMASKMTRKKKNVISKPTVVKKKSRPKVVNLHIYFLVSPRNIGGRWTHFLTNMFQRGWNHQLENIDKTLKRYSGTPIILFFPFFPCQIPKLIIEVYKFAQFLQ